MFLQKYNYWVNSPVINDEIRNELLEKGIILEDTRQGVKWRRA